MVPNRQRGFILVATIWILAVITIAATYFAERVSRSIALSQQKQETAALLVEFSNTRAEILYRLGTTPMSFHGLGEQGGIALDDRPYFGSGEDIVRLQDNRGLINVNFVEPRIMSRLLGQLGVPVDKRDPMIDTLLDYIDTDDLRRLNGAEAAEYAALGLPPPPNDWLASPYQLKNIIGWRDQPGLWENQGLMRLVTTSRITGFNPNTAPREILAILPGSNQEVAATIIKMRTEKPIYNLGQVEGFAQGAIDQEFLFYFPSDSIRITHRSAKLPWTEQYSMTLTPLSETAPWRIDYHVKTAVTYPTQHVDKIQKLPAKTPAPPGEKETL